jgi:hypothetical protein
VIPPRSAGRPAAGSVGSTRLGLPPDRSAVKSRRPSAWPDCFGFSTRINARACRPGWGCCGSH